MDKHSKERGLRVKVLFGDFEVEPSWLSVSSKYCRTIADVEQKILSRFHDLKYNEIKLMLADCRIPSWESIDILRDGDTIHVKEDQRSSLPNIYMKKPKNKSPNLALSCLDEDNTVCAEKPSKAEQNEEVKDIQKHGSKRSSEQNQADEFQDNHLTDFSIDAYCKLQDHSDFIQAKKKRKRKRKNKTDHEIHERPSHCWSPPATELSYPSAKSNSFQLKLQNKHITFCEEEMSNKNDDQQWFKDHSDERVSSQCQDKMNPRKEMTLSNGVIVYTRPNRRNHSPNDDLAVSRKCDVFIEQPEFSEKIGHGTMDVMVTVPDYNHLPRFEGLPCSGDKIAFKTLQLTERQSPTLSSYKVGIVKSYDPISTNVELHQLDSYVDCLTINSSSLEKDHENWDMGKVTLEWSNLLEAKLLS